MTRKVRRDVFDNIAPIDYRYFNEPVTDYLSERAFTEYKLAVEAALIVVLAKRAICPPEIVEEVKAACSRVTCQEVAREEKKTRHDLKALVNCIRRRVSRRAKPYIHLTATSYDIIETANAVRYRDVTLRVLVPQLWQLLGALIALTLREADTVQVGRTHGQHALPITFGFAIARDVDRLGSSIVKLEELADELRGKFSGAVGAYNAASLLFENPEDFEDEVMYQFDLMAAEHSTQVVPPEALLRLMSEVVITAGIIANLCRDMRNLQRTEIREVGEVFEKDQVGSSAMPQKRNPITFENGEGLWDVVSTLINLLYRKQVSEHQRDLTGSAPARLFGEIIAYTFEVARRLTGTMQKLVVDRESMARNLAMTRDMMAAEPLHIILSSLGHVNAHEAVRKLTLTAEANRTTLGQELLRNRALRPYVARMTERQRQIIADPAQHYTGIAAKKARDIAEHWRALHAL